MNPDEDDVTSVRRHLRAGFWGLALFVATGALLEGFHAFKAPFYVDADRETARLLLRLGHAHGTLLALVNVVYAAVLRSGLVRRTAFASSALLGALVLLPGGFFVGGIFAKGGDPGLGIVAVPLGAAALFGACVAIARAIRADGDDERAGPR